MDAFNEGGRQVGRIFGVVIGVVTDNKDPEGMYRVKVKFPWILETSLTGTADSEDYISNWARIATIGAGGRRGFFWMPEIEDEVLVAFEHGDISRPYIIGSLHNGVDVPTHTHDDSWENHWRSIKSRSGGVIQFYDEDGKEQIVIQTKTEDEAEADTPDARKDTAMHWIRLDATSGSEKVEIYGGEQDHYILIDQANKKITIEAKTGDMDILAENTITMKCTDLVIETSADTSIDASGAVSIKAGSTINAEASSTHTIKGSQVKIN